MDTTPLATHRHVYFGIGGALKTMEGSAFAFVFCHLFCRRIALSRELQYVAPYKTGVW